MPVVLMGNCVRVQTENLALQHFPARKLYQFQLSQIFFRCLIDQFPRVSVPGDKNLSVSI